MRNTTELALVTQSVSTILELPSGQRQAVTLTPGTTVAVRRWLRLTPLAIAWVSDRNAYATAPVPREALRFEGWELGD